MDPRSPRPRLLAAALATVVGLAGLSIVVATPAHAATIYTWTGEQTDQWGNPQNWSPQGIPTNGDGVSLAARPAGSHSNIENVPDVTLSQLTVQGDPDTGVSFSGSGHVIVGNLQWTGGAINVDLTVSAPPLDPTPSLISPQQTPLTFGAGGDQELTFLSDVHMPLGLGAGQGAWLTLMFDSNLRIGSTSTFHLDTGADILSSRCCTGGTSTVIVDGRLELAGSTGFTARLRQLGLDLAGEVQVPSGNTLEVVGGPVRVGGDIATNTVGDASLSGGGTLDIVETDGDAFVPADPRKPDTTMKFLDDGETLTLAGGSVLRLGPFATTSGIGRIAGSGALELAGATIRGDLTVDAGVPVSTVAGTTSRITYWDRTVPGQRGVLTPKGGLRVTGGTPGSTLRVEGHGRLNVPDGSTLHVPAGGKISSGGCCTTLGEIRLAPSSRLRLGDGLGDPALIKWVDLGGSGEVLHVGRSEWDVPYTSFVSGARINGTGQLTGDLLAGPAAVTPTGLLRVDGDYVANTAGVYRPTLPASRSGTTAPSRMVVSGTARLSGRVQPRGTTSFPAGHRVVLLEAGTVEKQFLCSVAPGMVLDHGRTNVALRAIGARTPDCTHPASGRVIKATYQGKRTAKLGVGSVATRVLVEVTVTGGDQRSVLRVSAGKGSEKIRVGAGRKKKVTVLLRVSSARKLTAKLSSRATVAVTRVGWTA
jgi:hypothetical protein